MTPAMVVALTIWAEARGETPAGREAVASVIMWRARDMRRVKTVSGRDERLTAVCREPKQFSCWNDGALERLTPTGESWEHAQALAAAMVAGTFRSTITATHYHADYVRPSWAARLKLVRQIGHHKFYV